MKLLLDTSAYSWFMRFHPAITESVAEAQIVGLSATVLGELKSGFRCGSRQAENEQRLGFFVAEPRVVLYSIDAVTAERYAVIRDFLRRNGMPLPPNDVWIAATAMQYGLKLITTDRHFLRLPQILVECFEPL
jgi:tRNA(fMet)-specific endonuclease VapC